MMSEESQKITANECSEGAREVAEMHRDHENEEGRMHEAHVVEEARQHAEHEGEEAALHRLHVEEEDRKRKKREEVDVKVTYAPAHHPAKRVFYRSAPVKDVLVFAMKEFAVENTAEVHFYLTFGRTKIENVDQSLGDLVGHCEDEACFRLVDEKVYG